MRIMGRAMRPREKASLTAFSAVGCWGLGIKLVKMSGSWGDFDGELHFVLVLCWHILGEERERERVGGEFTREENEVYI